MAAPDEVQRFMNATAAYMGLTQTGIVYVHKGLSKGFAGPRIYGQQNVKSQDWIDWGYWAVAMSTNVSSIRYLKKEHVLVVAFITRGYRPVRVYKYYGVEPYRAEQMFRSQSLGKFVHSTLKRQYACQGPFSPTNL